MRTPDEIKKGLECREIIDCYNTICPYFKEVDCLSSRLSDVHALIQQLERGWDELFEKAKQLETERDQYKRERDAAVADLAGNRRCENCKHFTPGYFCLGCRRGDQWEWRGVQGVE